MFGRKRCTSVDVIAGCFVCNGTYYMWNGANAMAVAARHHDKTGHSTWVEQNLSIRYGDDGTEKSPETENGS